MSYKADSMTIADLMRDIKSYYLPAIQREFVWPTEKIEALFDSILRGYPVGTLLIWDVREPAIHDFQFYELIRKYDIRSPHNVKADLSSDDRGFGILDGQQRMTSLYIGLKGNFIKKRPNLWWTNPNAFFETKLYINLLYEPKDDSDQLFQIKFLSDQQAQHDASAYWFRVGDILLYSTQGELRNFRRNSPYNGNDVFEDNLEALWNAIHKYDTISYFLERRDDLDEVLQILVRLNSGGTPLDEADLLLSLATATWKDHDAREEVYGLVETLNKDYGFFNFSKNFILKTLLVLSEGSVGFKAANIRHKSNLEQTWPRVADSLKTTVHLLSIFGFNGQNLLSPNAVIPIAYYVYKRNLNDSFITQKGYEKDRETIRLWLLKMLLGRVFSGQSDTVLAGVRQVIKDAVEAQPPTAIFPVEAIQQYLSSRAVFVPTEDFIETLISETNYGDALAFTVLALLFPNLNYQHSFFHIDHMHPSAHFTRQKLRRAGMSANDVEFAVQHRNRLSNLHLLPGLDNLSKNDTPLAQWLSAQSNPALMCSFSLIPDVDLSLSNFPKFYEERKKLLLKSLREKLGVTLIAPEPDGLVDTALLITGQPDSSGLGADSVTE